MSDGARRRYTSLFVAVGIALATGAAGGALTRLGPWYRNLTKPWFQPPDWLFGPVWTLIFLLSAYAAHRLWIASSRGQKTSVVVLFGINIVLNLGWSYLFFFIQRPDLSVYGAVALWLSVLAIIVLIGQRARVARWLLAPYLAWVAFATVLNWQIVRLNAPLAS